MVKKTLNKDIVFTVEKGIHNEWDNFEHMHKYLVRQDDLNAGTAYFIGEYPSIVKCCAHKWVNKEWG